LALQQAGLRVLGVEFDPEVVMQMRRQGLAVHYGDGTEGELLASLPLNKTRWLVSTLPDTQTNRDFLRALQQMPFDGQVAVVAREESEAALLAPLGNPTLLYPMRNAIDYAVDTLTRLIQHPPNSTPKVIQHSKA
jgi:voltage-gated potassium channel Kch